MSCRIEDDYDFDVVNDNGTGTCIEWENEVFDDYDDETSASTISTGLASLSLAVLI